MSAFRLDGKIAVVTGGGSGIGQAIAETFARNGAIVRIIDLDSAKAEATAQRILQANGSASAHPCDLANQEAVNIVFGELAAKERLHILVNNAGVSHIGNLESTTEEDP